MMTMFILFISLPAIFGLILPKRANSLIENRRLADLPKAPKNWQELKIAPKQFDQYYSDHFGFRWSLLFIYRHLKFFIHDSPLETAFFAKQKGWIFYSSKIDGDSIGDYRNINRFSDKQLATMISHLKQKQQWLAKQNIEYLFVIAPSKYYIYPEHLPNYIKPIKQQNLVEQLVEELKKHPEINFINLRPALQKAKGEEPFYFKADSHWNFVGTNIAQYEMAKKIDGLFPNQISPFLYKQEHFTQKSAFEGDLALYMGLGKYFSEEMKKPAFDPCTDFLKKDKNLFHTNCSGSALNTLIFRDSFFTGLQAYISQYFQHSTFVWQKMTFSQSQRLIKQNKPDIVIEEWIDRYLPRNYSPKR